MTTSTAQGSTTPPPPAPASASQPNTPNVVTTVTGDANVSVSGVFSVGGDFTIYQQDENEFTTLKLDDYESPYFPSPRRIDHFVQSIRTHRMLVLAGSSGIDKSDLARHIAWHFSDLIKSDPATAGNPIVVMEWIRNPNTQKLLLRIQRAKNPTIFLLPEVSSRDIRTEEIAKLQQITNHYILISTDVVPQDWSLPDTTRTSYWCDLVAEDLFDPQELERTLVERMLRVRDVLPPGLVENALAGKPLDGQLTLSAIISRLKTFNKTLVFVSALRGQQTLAPGHLDSLVKDIAKRDTMSLEQVIADWYRTMLNSRERLFALNASFFAGLMDDQFFAAVEYLHENIWRRRNPQLEAYDYNDLTDVGLYFNLTETTTAGLRVEMRVPHQRYLMLQAAWNSSRRQILAALPKLVTLVRDSVHNQSSNPELFNRPAKQTQLRNVIAETISDIGLLDVGAVQQTLVSLATDEKIEVQAVAASAIARWRYYNHEQQLFELLQAWQFETRMLDLFAITLQGREKSSTIQVSTYARATIALAVGYAATYDPPNKLSDELRKLVIELAEDNKPLVRNRFRSYTLQLVVPYHLAQLQDELRQMTRFFDLDRPIAISLSSAYRVVPKDVMRTLAIWSNEAMKSGAPVADPKKPALRETTIATIALTYGEINYEEEGPLTADEGFERLKLILNSEAHPFIRTAAIIALCNQAKQNFDQVEPFLHRSLVDVYDSERDDVVEVLLEIYREQRAALEGGDEYAIIKNSRYPIWFGTRSLTTIEQAMVRWMKDGANNKAQQIAVRAQVRFAQALDQEIDTYIRQRRMALEQKKDASSTASPVIKTEVTANPGWAMSTFAPFMATINSPQYRPIIRGLLPEAVKQQRASGSAMGYVIDGFTKSQDAEIKAIMERLRSAISYYNNRFAYLGVVLLVVFVMLCQVLN